MPIDPDQRAVIICQPNIWYLLYVTVIPALHTDTDIIITQCYHWNNEARMPQCNFLSLSTDWVANGFYPLTYEMAKMESQGAGCV